MIQVLAEIALCNLFLQILDAGRLRDTYTSAEVDFSKWTVNTEYQRTVNTGTKDKVENTETKSKSTENLEDKAFKILKTIIENI